MSIQLTFLGTSCSTPTPQRNLSSMALVFRGNWFLFDTPEGVQQQLMRSNHSIVKLNHIFISHFHGDHTLGLPGLLATMTTHERTQDLHVYGPRGIGEFVSLSIKLADFFPSFKIIPHEIQEGILVEEKEFSISAVKLNHSSTCYGFFFEAESKEGEFQRAKAIKLKIPEGPLWGKLQRGETIVHNGKKFTPNAVMDYSKAMEGTRIAYIMDTFPHVHYVDAVKDMNVHVLIHEASFLESEKERAVEVKHSTAKMAGEVAKHTQAKQLILTHFSARYPNGKDMAKEAGSVFKNVTAAHDLMVVELPERHAVETKKIKTSKKVQKK
jgi:ribonuclease Z